MEREAVQRALEHLHASDDTLMEVMNIIDKKQDIRPVKRAGKWALRTVLVAALMAALSIITALAVSERGFLHVIRNSFNVHDQVPDAEIVQMQDIQTGEFLYFVHSDTWNIIVDDQDGNATSYTVLFAGGENTPDTLGDWKLGKLPDGYEQTGLARDDRWGEVTYLSHPEGKSLVASIRFSYELPGRKTTFFPPFDMESVTVNGDGSVLIKGPVGMEGFQSQKLYWFSSDAGVGFILDYYGDPALDQINLVELAQSIGPV